MVFSLSPIWQGSYQTPCQYTETFTQTIYIPHQVVADIEPAAGSLSNVRRFSSLRKKARGPVSKFEREFFL